MSEQWHFVSAPRLVFLNYLLPPFSVVLALALEGVPNAFFSGIMPFFGPIVVFYWALYRPKYIPKTVAFFLGLFSDVLFSPFMGLHGLIYLCVRQIAVVQRRYLAMRKFTTIWTIFSLVITGFLALQNFYLQTLGFMYDPFVLTKLTQTIFAFPFVYYVLARLHYALLHRGWL